MLEIVAAGMRFVARWEEELAPKTVAAFKASLPLDDRIIHCRWSGESNWIPWGDRDFGIGPENATSYPHPGELALYPEGRARRSCCSRTATARSHRKPATCGPTTLRRSSRARSNCRSSAA